MRMPVIVMGLIALSFSGAAEAAAWNLSGYYSLPSANGPGNLTISVEDENGLPVKNLEPANFQIGINGCAQNDPDDCYYQPTTIIKPQQFTFSGGVYFMKFKQNGFSPETDGTILVRVGLVSFSVTTVGQHGSLVFTQHAQMIMKH